MASGFQTTAATLSSSFNASLGPKCVSRQTPVFLLFSLLPSLAILINVVVLAAVLRKARKLVRQSHVYAYVSSTLIANVLFSVLALVQVLSLYFHFGGLPNDPDPGRRGLIQEESSRWWAFRKSFLCGMFVIMCGNIGLLIDCIRHSTCSTLRSAAGCRNHQDKTSRWKKKLLTRRQRSYVMIAVLWVVPIVYVAIPVVGWSCREVCQCLSQCFPSQHIYLPHHHKCSRAFPPMANSWLAVVVISWACCLIAIVFFLRRSLHQVTSMWTRCHSTQSMRIQRESREVGAGTEGGQHHDKARDRDESGLHLSDELGKDDVFASECHVDCKDPLEPGRAIVTSLDDKRMNSDKSRDSGVYLHNTNEQSQSLCVVGCVGRSSQYARTASESSGGSTMRLKAAFGAPNRHRMMEHLRSTCSSSFSLRYVIWLTVFFALCTAPTMAILTVDMLYRDLALNMAALNICLLCPFVYCYICPFILIKCLPGVKTSLSALILSVYSTTD